MCDSATGVFFLISMNSVKWLIKFCHSGITKVWSWEVCEPVTYAFSILESVVKLTFLLVSIGLLCDPGVMPDSSLRIALV